MLNFILPDKFLAGSFPFSTTEGGCQSTTDSRMPKTLDGETKVVLWLVHPNIPASQITICFECFVILTRCQNLAEDRKEGNNSYKKGDWTEKKGNVDER